MSPEDRLRQFVSRHAVFFSSGTEFAQPLLTAQTLEEAAKLIKAAETTLVRVVGYTDSQGGARQNSPLALSRATAVVDALAALGVPRERLLAACEQIKVELKDRLEYLRQHQKLLEAQRLEQRTMLPAQVLGGRRRERLHLARQAGFGRRECGADGVRALPGAAGDDGVAGAHVTVEQGHPVAVAQSRGHLGAHPVDQIDAGIDLVKRSKDLGYETTINIMAASPRRT